jgi:Arc/MetJ-type ribon-helix-helix transcriptional regulator
MTIHLPGELESSVRAAVLQGQFASEDEAVAEIVRDYFRRREAGQGPPVSGATNGNASLGLIGALRDDADVLDQAVEHAIKVRAVRTSPALRPTPPHPAFGHLLPRRRWRRPE